MALAETHHHDGSCTHVRAEGHDRDNDLIAPPVRSRPSILPPWVPAALVGLLGLTACVIVNLRDPNQSGSYGFCPSLALFGVDCPGCGLMRGTHALTNGDLGTALDHNLLIVPVFALIGYAYVRWAASTVGYELPNLRPRNWMIWTTAAVVLAYTILRNVGGSFEYFSATAG